MTSNFEKAFQKLTECVEELGKGVESMVNEVFTEKEGNGTMIRIKKGSTVMIKKGVYATLTQDVEAELLDSSEEKSEQA
jgi:hypothetical protein